MAALGRRAAGGPLLAQEATRPDGDSIIIVPFGGITDHFGLVLAWRYFENRFGRLTRPFYLLNKAEKKKQQTPRATGILGVLWCFSLFSTSLKVDFSDFPFLLFFIFFTARSVAGRALEALVRARRPWLGAAFAYVWNIGR